MNNEVETVVAVIDSSSTDGELDLARQITTIGLQAESLIVSSDNEYAQAGAFGRELKAKMAEVAEFFAPLKKSAHEAHKQICEREKTMLKPLKDAEAILKRAMGGYALERERKRIEAEETARRLAKEEAERKLAESVKAEEAGDKEAAEMALLDAEIAEAASSYIVIEEDKLDVKGVSTTTDWEIDSIDMSKVPVTLAGVVLRPVDTTAVIKLIRASKGKIAIPGIEYKQVAKVSFRR